MFDNNAGWVVIDHDHWSRREGYIGGDRRLLNP